MESKFQFIKPILKSVEYVVNENFEKDTTKSIDMNMNMTVSVKKSVVSSTEASVSLTVNLGEKNNDDFPFYLNITESAEFKWCEDMEEKMVDQLLRQNAPALLLSYLRPTVAQITFRLLILVVNHRGNLGALKKYRCLVLMWSTRVIKRNKKNAK